MNNKKSNTFLSFYLGKELFGADVKFILEVLKDEPITEIPRSEDFIKGIINFRGEIVTVVDFFKKLNMHGESAAEKNIVIVIELTQDNKNVKVGLLADRVRKVFEMPIDEIKPVPEFGEYYNPEFLTGVAKTTDGLVMLLNLEKILNEKEVNLILKSNNKEK